MGDSAALGSLTKCEETARPDAKKIRVLPTFPWVSERLPGVPDLPPAEVDEDHTPSQSPPQAVPLDDVRATVRDALAGTRPANPYFTSQAQLKKSIFFASTRKKH